MAKKATKKAPVKLTKKTPKKPTIVAKPKGK